MAYSELIKNFNKIRDYMRDFYVYGFKSRDDYTKKSARSYDDEKRRIESWLGDYMKFHQTADGKNVFLSIDSRVTRHNPLYKAWKTKSFTDGDITLHFIVMDILSEGQELSLGDIAYQVDEYLAVFGHARVFDASTIRKKLNEYVKEGVLLTRKNGKTMLYRRTEELEIPSRDVLDFFSETAPCGVLGSFLEDKTNDIADHFVFKHHYIMYYLRLDAVRDVIELPIDDVLDINGWDLQKTLRLLYKSNPTLFEWFSSPIVYQKTEFADKFRELMMHYFSSKKTLYHYISMAEGNYREYLQGEIVRVKKYFYVLRPVLACQWILDRGTPPPMLFSELIKEELPIELINPVNQLLELKMNSSEVKLIKRITEINEYLDTSIPSIKSAVRLLDDSHTPDWNELNQLFLRELMK